VEEVNIKIKYPKEIKLLLELSINGKSKRRNVIL
jgi:hypothetical protein